MSRVPLKATSSLQGELATPLLRRPDSGSDRHATSFTVLYIIVFLRTTAFTMVAMPVLWIRLYNLTLSAGESASAAVLALGVMMALRYLSEFAAVHLLPSLAQRVGWRVAFLLLSMAVSAECDFMGLASSPLLLGTSHVLAGLFFSNGMVERRFIMDKLPAGRRCDEAQGALLTCFTTAFVLGPLLGGRLLHRYGNRAPGNCANLLILLTILLLHWIPTSPSHGRRSIAAAASCSRPPWRTLARIPGVASCCLACWLSSCGMALFGAVSIFWMTFGLRWNAEQQGGFLALGSWVLMMTKEVALPVLIGAKQSSEWLLVKICLVSTALRFLAFMVTPSGMVLAAVVIVTCPGFGSTPLLTALCLSLVPKSQQEHWEHFLVGLNTSASIVGSLLGTGILVRAMQASQPLAPPLLMAATCYLGAAFSAVFGQHSSRRQPPDGAFSNDVGPRRV